MQCVLVIFFLLFGQHKPHSDRDRFMQNYHNKLIKINSLQLLEDNVRFSTGHGCPELILFIFNASGKRDYISAFSKEGFCQLVRETKERKGPLKTWCVLLGNKVYTCD